ncbi:MULTISPECIES: bifunctional nicotinamidase/pyrazinamidase [Sphingobacterium]|uniref:Nicotinamidase n=1 Tax=Sphingobacterium cellulitidis TaxID=1768011 RepID=A0A8H9FX81_9SPHI|nr:MULTISPECIES: bifunctional nicotinamidase/pyrazinamidase [Sphingobacterium]MBA8985379.1 nicotinamidase/pyrazinamidase [Sphingobacterium soli]WFB63801.1 bifunctional nicotinamidase/pyrazinamidase [Sphingobacterium sp. WM]GGE10116.1 bifunctional pyrazinamidase/nicotinamidase [Sphingobacterium soli]
MKALIIVDVQYDFLPGGSLEVPKGDEIIPIINNIQKDYDLVVASQDWHPQGHLSFASQHEHKLPFEIIDLDGLEQVLWPDHCIQESYGSQISEDLQTNRVEAIFRKGMDPKIDSYSAFYDNGKRKDTGLAGYLKARNIDEVHVCGLAADFCVFFTAMDAISEGFKTSIISKATKAIDKGAFMEKKNTFIQAGGSLL